MKISGASIKHCKQRGEWAELRFMARASEHGFFINKPWGESRRYDFASEYNGKFLRIQVKSTTYKRGKSYVCNLSCAGRDSYNSEEVDIIAIYIIPKNIWYILPSYVTKGKPGLMLSPHMDISKYSAYEEAWHLLKGEEMSAPVEVHPTTTAT